MLAETTPTQWAELRRRLMEAADRFALLLRQASRPGARAVGSWSVAETGAHVAAIAKLNAAMLASEPSPLPIEGFADLMREATFADIARLNALVLDYYTERTPDVLSDWVRHNVELILSRSADLAPDTPATWLGGAQLPAISILAHQLNELLVHGFDIAKAAAADWVIPPADAAFTFELFLLRLLGGQSGNLLKSWAGKPNQRRIAVEFRSEHTEPAVIATHGGRVSVERPGRDVDARIRFDPPALMLTIFRRHHPLRPVMTGKIVVSGRSPWLVPPFLNRTRAP